MIFQLSPASLIKINKKFVLFNKNKSWLEIMNRETRVSDSFRGVIWSLTKTLGEGRGNISINEFILIEDMVDKLTRKIVRLED